jgi:tetratricopeptide (TPR) repeat protein
MRGTWIVAALLVGALVPGAAPAGVYNTAEPWPAPSFGADGFNVFQQQWAGYRLAAADLSSRASAVVSYITLGACPSTPWAVTSARVQEMYLPPQDQSLGLHYYAQVRALEEKDRQGLLTLEDRINLGAYLIRLAHYDRAIRVMENAPSQRHFLLLANLATAHELAGDPQKQAANYRRRALAAWPKSFAGWSTAMLNFYRKAETYQLQLLELRQKEPPSRGRLRLDDLFPGVKFNGPNGEYAVGGIDSALWVKIPSDAAWIVMQLLLWTPFDDPLIWQLGELLNASGNVREAAAVLGPLVQKGQGQSTWSSLSPELEEHYRLLARAAEQRKAFDDALLVSPLGAERQLLLMQPRGDGGVPVAGALALEAGRVQGMLDIDRVEKAILKAREPALPPPPAEAANDKNDKNDKPAGWVPDWRQIVVSFAAGAVVAWLLGMQFRNGRRAR